MEPWVSVPIAQSSSIRRSFRDEQTMPDECDELRNVASVSSLITIGITLWEARRLSTKNVVCVCYCLKTGITLRRFKRPVVRRIRVTIPDEVLVYGVPVQRDYGYEEKDLISFCEAS